jgi:predicted enzyme related to lactoylglutathione lyase
MPGTGGPQPLWGVADIAAAHARLIQLGASPLDPITDVGGGIKVAAVMDPFGNRFGVIENPHFTASAVR